MKPKITGGYPQPIAHVPDGEMRTGGASKEYKNKKIDRDVKKAVNSVNKKLKQKKNGRK